MFILLEFAMAPNWPISWNKRDQQKGPITIFSGRGKKTTSAMALMDWSVWRHCRLQKIHHRFQDDQGLVLLFSQIVSYIKLFPQ